MWGCLAKVKISKIKRKKIGPKTVDAIFLGYASGNNANRFLVFNSEINDIGNNIIIESRDATFFENIFPYKSLINTKVSNDLGACPSRVRPREEETPPEPRRSQRARKEKTFGDDFITLLMEELVISYEDAIRSIDSPFRKEAIDNEMQSIL